MASSSMVASATTSSVHVIVFPADGRAPHLSDMHVSRAGPDYYSYAMYSPTEALIPHPEIHMEYIAEGLAQPAYQSLVR